jgi:4-diphosphocytidyl-2-C-methyl-D-erythritol kinase
MPTRAATVRSLAKLNLSLKVIEKRTDGYHELRTVFQTVSLADSIDLEWTPGESTAVVVECEPDIPDNIAARAAKLVIEAAGHPGTATIRISKRIAQGAGLGGGSSNAAAVVLALPVLIGARIDAAAQQRLASDLGSDVPFFLEGGTVLGIGRGTEIYPLNDVGRTHGLVVVPEVAVSTAEAYGWIGRKLTEGSLSRNLNSFQSFVWGLGGRLSGRASENDFEEVVFEQRPLLREIKGRLEAAGASPAMMTGSGSAVFGLYKDRQAITSALTQFADDRAYPITFISRGEYRSMWWRQLRDHIQGRTWPLRSRYEP